MDERRDDMDRPEPVRVEGWLTGCAIVTAPTRGRPAEGVTATVTELEPRYGCAHHVTFPSGRDLDLWITAINHAWAEAQSARAALIRELPDYMRPTRDATRLRIIIWGRLCSSEPQPPTGVRRASIVAVRVAFPTLDAATLARADELWQRARRHRHNL